VHFALPAADTAFTMTIKQMATVTTVINLFSAMIDRLNKFLASLRCAAVMIFFDINCIL